ncbi:uncharacterized protein BDW47DRAFT_129451 [Aspergillus candidus]|uniref:Uncharacterized protein n=1 Tax=Aspergillus candidus TaxID=41067 RepID=A0A2I2EZY8_ASPCN|nr:hypothetical protein BDW47DRAFT_129451 [Aspergillus candidus]PLB33961.1 hypothetical protein BDW47DRAFT_129451 [Aspergillus candidus]
MSLMLEAGKTYTPREDKSTAWGESEKHHLFFFDRFCIAIDRTELLPSLRSAEYELLLVGLHSQRDLKSKPSRSSRCSSSSAASTTTSQGIWANIFQHSPTNDPLEISTRLMPDIELDLKRTFSAIEKWRQPMDLSVRRPQLTRERHSILTSRLLYHISLLASTRKALLHAFAILKLLTDDGESSASSASLPQPASAAGVSGDSDDNRTTESLTFYHRGNNTELLSECAQIYRQISPGWRMVSSFAAAASPMAARPFPLLQRD